MSETTKVDNIQIKCWELSLGNHSSNHFHDASCWYIAGGKREETRTSLPIDAYYHGNMC